MLRKLKHTISISLVIILLLPMTIKLMDSSFHHHDHFHCTAKNEKHFHKYHEKCPIPGFELSFFSVDKHFQTTQKHFYGEEYIDNYSFEYCCKRLNYSFLLRAPPVFTSKTITSELM